MHQDPHSPVAALVGAPNSGKTTLFNWLTGARFKAVNYPGATVDYAVGRSQSRYGDTVTLIDTPGAYSLFPKSPDEHVTVDVLFGGKIEKIEKVIVVVDATQLSRHLYLAQQVIDAGFDVILAVTMVDLVRADGGELNQKQLGETLKCPVVLIDGTLGGGVDELLQEVRRQGSIKETPKTLSPWNSSMREQKLKDSVALAESVLVRKNKGNGVRPSPAPSLLLRTAQLDQWFLNRYFGPLIFLAIMTGLFTSIFWLATPFMDLIDEGTSFLAEQVRTSLGQGLWGDFFADGVVASFGAFLIFVPQIFILFFGIGLLEDSGYLARAATLIDRPFSKLGLNGRSFVPLLSGFACAVPAMMAARTIGSKKERWITLFVIPLMTCSARLPVYALLLSFLFFGKAAWIPGLALAFLYIGAVVVGALVAAVLDRFIKTSGRSLFMLELPLYRRPLVRVVARNAMMRTKSYVTKAGPIIFLFAMLIWVGTTFPRVDSHQLGENQLQASYLGQVGHVIEPVFEPMGVDWRVGVGLLTAFAAREVLVSSLAVMFNVPGDDVEEDSVRNSLILSMQQATNRSGNPIFTVATVVGLLFFVMVSLQCLSTTAIAVRELGSWKVAIAQVVAFNLLGYVGAVMLVQGLRALGVA